jgi:hypothetical protein
MNSAHDPLEKVKDVLRDFLKDIDEIQSNRIPDPLGGEKVHSYLERLKSILIHEKERRKVWWHSLRSFTKFLRDQARLIEDFGELDVIFPEDMTIYFDTILRKVQVSSKVPAHAADLVKKSSWPLCDVKSKETILGLVHIFDQPGAKIPDPDHPTILLSSG